MIAVWLAACTVAPTPPVVSEVPRADTRSVVVFYVDTLRADHLGAWGYAAPTSPHLDRFAASGRRYSHAYAASPWTYSSTASLWTGLSVQAHGAELPGAVRNEARQKGEVVRLHDHYTTLAERLRAAGYDTALFYNNGYLTHGLEQGFDEVRRQRLDDQERIPAVLEWLEQRDGAFFLTVHFMDVHAENQPSVDSRAHFPALSGLDDDALSFASRRRRPRAIEGRGLDRSVWLQRRVASYDASIRDVDALLPPLVEAALAKDPETLFVFTADHGEALDDHLAFERARYRLPWFGVGHGHTFFDEVVRVPLVLWGQGVSPEVVPERVSLLDVAPTVLEAVGLPAQGPIEGRSLWTSTPAARPLVIDSVAFGSDRTALLLGPLKYVRTPFARERPSLMNLQADPAETTDLAELRPEDVVRLDGVLSEQLAAAKALGSAILAGRERQVHTADDEEREELRALGYLP